MNEQIKYRLLPSEPTPAMLEAEQFASSLAYESHEVQAVEVYRATWQAAPEVEPLSDEGMDFVLEEYYKTKGASFKTLIRLVEKAHGIGETKCT